MANVENNVVVHIFGEDYPITGLDDPTHITRVAEYVDSKMKEAARAGRIQARDKVAILAAMSIASELLERAEFDDPAQRDAQSALDRVLAGLNDALADQPVAS